MTGVIHRIVLVQEGDAMILRAEITRAGEEPSTLRLDRFVNPSTRQLGYLRRSGTNYAKRHKVQFKDMTARKVRRYVRRTEEGTTAAPGNDGAEGHCMADQQART